MSFESTADFIKSDWNFIFNQNENDIMLDFLEAYAKKNIENIKELNAKAYDPDAMRRQPLVEWYREEKWDRPGLKGIPDFYYKGYAERSLTYRIDLTSRKIVIYHDDPEADLYMYMHEHGTGNMPQRRQFATEDDMRGGRRWRLSREDLYTLMGGRVVYSGKTDNLIRFEKIEGATNYADMSQSLHRETEKFFLDALESAHYKIRLNVDL